MANIENLAGYKFQKLDLDTIRTNRIELRDFARKVGVLGSVLLSEEGCNMFIAATHEKNQIFIEELFKIFPELSDMQFKVSMSGQAPFSRMLIKEKKEIITLGQNSVNAVQQKASDITPTEFASNYGNYTVIDTRNSYETKLGKFEGALDLNLDSFREFPEAMLKTLPPAEADKPIVIYCTGGIRCEKAGLWMQQAGYNNVFQLKDGILGYFEQCGNNHYEGECFVFDKRVGVDHKLDETNTEQCYECRTPWSNAEIEKRAGICSCGNKVHWYQ